MWGFGFILKVFKRRHCKLHVSYLHSSYEKKAVLKMQVYYNYYSQNLHPTYSSQHISYPPPQLPSKSHQVNIQCPFQRKPREENTKRK